MAKYEVELLEASTVLVEADSEERAMQYAVLNPENFPYLCCERKAILVREAEPTQTK